MSNSDGFIEEVSEEVRRDRFYHLLRRYGWVGGVVVLLIVGGAAWSEYSKAQARAEAEALGDQILAALSQPETGDRQTQLEAITPSNPGAQAVVGMLSAAEAQQAGNTEAAVGALDQVSVNGDVPEIYRQVAAFKALVLQAGDMDVDSRRQQLEALAAPGAPLALLAEEQLALLEIENGETDAAITRLQSIVENASVSTDLQQRALQVIVALGGIPDLENLPGLEN